MGDTINGRPRYLACERKWVYALLIMAAGMMGAYTHNLRGGVFCNAQTGNIVLMSIALGNGQWRHAVYFFIPVTAYIMGAVVSEIMPHPARRLGFLRWDTYLVGFEMVVLFAMGFIPLSAPHQIVQVTFNFIASMQYNTFRQAEGIPMATTFCTNHVRQIGLAFTKAVREKDRGAFKKLLTHVVMILFFIAGGASLTFLCRYFAEKTIWLAVIPMGVVFVRLVCADIFQEHGDLDRKPAGH